MRGRWNSLALLVCAAVIVSCGDDSSSSAPTKWLGPTPHLRIVGTINGEKLDINITGAQAANTTALWCEREYQVPTATNGQPDYSMGHNSEVRFKAPVTINGQARILDLEIKMHNFQADASGTVVTVVPRDDNNPPCAATGCTQPTHMWLQWVWINPTDGTNLYKMAAQTGQLTTGEFTGSPDATGLLITENTGSVGGFATGQWSATESLTVSFDVKCTTDDIDNG